MTFDKIILSTTQPSRTDVAWAKPVKGGFALYLHYNGIWNLMKLMDSNGSINPDDDKTIDPSSGGQPGPNTVGTEQLIDGAVEMQDLHEDVKGKIQKTYDISDESLSMDFEVVP